MKKSNYISSGSENQVEESVDKIVTGFSLLKTNSQEIDKSEQSSKTSDSQGIPVDPYLFIMFVYSISLT